MSFKVTGMTGVRRELVRLQTMAPGAMDRALHTEGELVMTDAKQNHVPIDLGPLMNSGHVQPTTRQGKAVVVVMSFGGPAAAYAAAVHERPSSHDPPSWKGVPVTFSPPGRGPKYLERPLRNAARGMTIRLVRRLRQERITGTP